MNKWPVIIIILLLTIVAAAEDQASRLDEALKLIRSDRTEEALPILYPLANEGNAGARIALGYYFLMQKNEQGEGLRWFRSAAISGDAEAQLHLGLVLTEILEGDENHEGGVRWLLESAKQGNRDAAMQLAAGYTAGKWGLPKDEETARYWHERAYRK